MSDGSVFHPLQKDAVIFIGPANGVRIAGGFAYSSWRGRTARKP
jgi:hypothetical protein